MIARRPALGAARVLAASRAQYQAQGRGRFTTLPPVPREIGMLR